MLQSTTRVFPAALLLAISALACSGPLLAGERASTDELPAALKALGVEPERVLTQRQAQEVRGEGIGPIVLAAVIQYTNPFNGETITHVAAGYHSIAQGTFIRGTIIGPVDVSFTTGAHGISVHIR